MKHTLSLNLIGVTMSQLEGFVNAAPSNSELMTVVKHHQGDRPWESEFITAELQAEWDA